MKFLLLALLLSLPVAAQTNGLRSLGTITNKNALGWDYDFEASPSVHSFRIFVASTNDPATIKSRLVSIGDVPSTQWPVSSNVTSGLNGPYAVSVCAVAGNKFTNVVGTNVTVVTNELLSDFSEILLINFRDGVPLPPSNFQLYSLVYAAATNALPRLTVPDEYKVSGR